MHKNTLSKNAAPEKGRILARCLAEDLRNVYAGGHKPAVIKATATETSPEGSRRDITNVGGDGDAT